MKKTILTFTILLIGFISTYGQSPLGFNYQSIIRDSNGSVISDTQLDLRISIVQSTIEGTIVYTETHSEKTNSFGLVNIVVGQGEVVSGNFSTINWGADNYFLQVEIDLNRSGDFTEIGTTQLLSVPFANYAFNSGSSESAWNSSEQIISTDKKVGIGTNSPNSSLQVVATENQKADEPIFEIKNSAGKTIFAVFENEVKVYLDENKESSGFTVSSRNDNDLVENLMAITPKQTNIYVGSNLSHTNSNTFAISGRTTTKEERKDILKITPEYTRFFVDKPSGKANYGGFAISGRTTTKDENKDIFKVTPNLTEIFVNENSSKTSFGGFAISGRTSTKSEKKDILKVTPNYTRFFVDKPSDKANYGGFAISGRTSTKGINNEIFKVTPGLTEVFIAEDMKKGVRGGFAVSGRTSTKDAIQFDIFNVQTDKTEVFIKKSNTKSLPDGFSVYGLNANLESNKLFNVSDSGTFVNTTISIAPEVETKDVSDISQITAQVRGSILNYDDVEIEKVGVIYNTENNLIFDENIENTPTRGVALDESHYYPDIYSEITNISPETTYYCRAFAISKDGLIGYGETKTFTTTALKTVTFTITKNTPTVGTPVTDAEITVIEASTGFSVTKTGIYELNLPDGSFTYWVYASGCTIKEGVFSSENTISVALEANSFPRKTFHVTNLFGNNINNASLLLEKTGSNSQNIMTNRLGIAYAQIEDGTYTCNISILDSVLETKTLNLNTEDQTFEFKVNAIRNITFDVIDQINKDIALGAEVQILKDGVEFGNFKTVTGSVMDFTIPEDSGYTYRIKYQGRIKEGNISKEGNQLINIYI